MFERHWDDWAVPDGGPSDACGDGDDPRDWEWGDGDIDDGDASPCPLDMLIAAEEAEVLARWGDANEAR